jgi:hypothetical protein
MHPWFSNRFSRKIDVINCVRCILDIVIEFQEKNTYIAIGMNAE